MAAMKAGFISQGKAGILKARAVEDRLMRDTWEVQGYDLCPGCERCGCRRWSSGPITISSPARSHAHRGRGSGGPPGQARRLRPLRLSRVRRRYPQRVGRSSSDRHSPPHRRPQAHRFPRVRSRPESGLIYEIVAKGNGASAQTGQTVLIHETLTLPDGRVIFTSRKNNQPVKFVLGADQVIQGVDEGVTGMRSENAGSFWFLRRSTDGSSTPRSSRRTRSGTTTSSWSRS